MAFILWGSSGLSTVAGALELTQGDLVLGLGLLALALVMGPLMAWVTR